MSQPDQAMTSGSFAKTFVLPALLVFLIPALSYLFFLHARATYNADARENITSQIRTNDKLTDEQREQMIAYYSARPFSELIQEEEIAANTSSEMQFHYATFRWAIRLSGGSVMAGVAVFILAGLFVLLSLRSPMAQYLSLSVGWHVLRIYGALQAVVQGALLVALSFWVTALWFNVYVIKLIVVVGILVLIAVGILLKAMFKRVSTEFEVEGHVISRNQDMPLWPELERICHKLGTEPPDQVIAGINDNFFVTEHPVTVGEEIYRGRTLFVSLSLLKQLNGAEADAVLAHEMAHFSGNDTLFSRRISPLLVRYDTYLNALQEGGVTLPIFYFMLCFRGMYELSLGKLSRQREYRADRLATDTTSPEDMAGALLRISAYSTYRDSVQEELFREQQALEAANVSERIEAGFADYAVTFLQDPAVEQMQTSHPFDSHPPLNERLAALGVPLSDAQAEALLAEPGDGSWFHNIRHAAKLEREQWHAFEEAFRDIHEESLAYRYLPSNPEEQAHVEKIFPPISFEATGPTLTLDFEKIQLSDWDEPVIYKQIGSMSLDDKGTLTVAWDPGGPSEIYLKSFTLGQDEVLEAINRYYSRYLTAVDFQQNRELMGPA